jgi:hypothetical protein
VKRVLEAITNLFARLFSRDFAAKLQRGIEAAAPYLAVAYSIVETAARLTPTRADDEILALAQELGVPALFDASEDKGIAIGRIVFRALKKRYPEAADRVLNRAIEIAYGALKP